MSDKVEIRIFRSRFLKGKYTPGTIWIREGLTPQERTLTLKHEMAHHQFYTQTRIGRLLTFFLFRKKVYYAYALLIGLTWTFLPLLYLPACVPLFLIDTHECLTSMQYPSKLSFLLAFTGIVGLYGLFWLRLILWVYLKHG